MKKIVLNKDNLSENDVDLTKKKVRALIVDDNNIITLCNYCNVYMMPGGKVEDNESVTEALLRELEEELGISFELDNLQELLTVSTMAKNYPVRRSNKRINRVCETDYYLIKSNRRIDNNRVKLTDSEKRNRFRIDYIPLDRVVEIVENNEHRSYRNKYFSKELLIVLNEYLKGELYKYNYSHKKGLIDLHIHTNASDGEKSSNEIVNEAILKGAQAISITDHDSLLGYRDLVYDRDKIKVISGIELSAFSHVGRMHILGYGFDLNNKDLNDKLVELHQNSINKILKLVDVLKKDYNIIFNEFDIEELIDLDRNIGRPDLAKLLIKYGIVDTVSEAFDKYLVNAHDKIRNSINKLDYQECFELIKGANGIPVLAHPHTLLLDDNSLYYKILEMKRNGLGGVEVYHSDITRDLSDKLIAMAIEQNLYITGGSDYHGLISKPEIELFNGRDNNIKVKKLNLVNDVRGI